MPVLRWMCERQFNGGGIAYAERMTKQRYQIAAFKDEILNVIHAISRNSVDTGDNIITHISMRL